MKIWNKLNAENLYAQRVRTVKGTPRAVRQMRKSGKCVNVPVSAGIVCEVATKAQVIFDPILRKK